MMERHINLDERLNRSMQNRFIAQATRQRRLTVTSNNLLVEITTTNFVYNLNEVLIFLLYLTIEFTKARGYNKSVPFPGFFILSTIRAISDVSK